MNIKKRIQNEDGFMGPTHAVSAIAFYLLLALFFKDFLISLGISNSLPILVVSSIVIAGAALIPDLDNTTSTAMSVLGIFGKLVSNVMRAIAEIVYSLTKSKYDDSNSNPHRGFWHTILAGIILGIIIKLSLNLEMNLPIKIFTIEKLNDLFAFVWVFFTIQLAMSALFNSFVKKSKNSILGKLSLSLLGIIISSVLIYFNNDYSWIPISISLGYIFHIIGDAMTVKGVPLLFPIPFKGKRWFNHRIMKIHAGSSLEKMFIFPLFVTIIIVCLGLLFFN